MRRAARVSTASARTAESAAPLLASTLTGYIGQVRLSLRASTMVRVEGVLREFACWLAACAPEVACVADLRRRQIEAYKLHLAGRPSARGGKLSRISLAEHLGALRACFERLTEWDGDDVPAAVLVFSGDLPLRDEPLPRFLDDGCPVSFDVTQSHWPVAPQVRRVSEPPQRRRSCLAQSVAPQPSEPLCAGSIETGHQLIVRVHGYHEARRSR